MTFKKRNTKRVLQNYH